MQSKRPARLERKFSIDGLNKSDAAKDRLSAFGLHKNGSKSEALVEEFANASSGLPERVNRRAEIVAAVTRRLYSHGKKGSEDKIAPTVSPPAAPPAQPDEGPIAAAEPEAAPQSPVLEVPAMNKIRLQEISRKMLAKRRRIIADTQTDFYESTRRVKDVFTITDKIKQRDAGVLTDEHEDLKSFGDGLVQVRRVKEMSTLTEKTPTTIVRFKDATSITENDNYNADPHVNPSDSSPTNADKSSNVDSAALTDGSTNTVLENLQPPTEVSPVVALKSKKPTDLSCEHWCKCCGRKLDSGTRDDSAKDDSKNVISITLPEDLLRITLETPNSLESTITVLENDRDVPGKVLRDSHSQTESSRKSLSLLNYYTWFQRRNRLPAKNYGLAPTLGAQLEGLRIRNRTPSVSRPKTTSRWGNESSLPLRDRVATRGRKHEDSSDSVFDMITEEVRINVSKRLTELRRYNGLGSGHVFWNMMYERRNEPVGAWYGYRE